MNEESLLSNIIYSQNDIHRPFGGVVPELASRAHLQTLIPTIEAAFSDAGLRASEIEGISVTFGPGLIGALLVGVNMAKAMSFALDIPLLGVNHLEGHLFAIRLDHPEAEPPLVSLLVSGGHTLLVLIEQWGRYNVLGQTIDDAAGEAFDKVAKMLDLGYPGGPAIDLIAQNGDPGFHQFPRSWLEADRFDFSFSGLKTSVLNYIGSKHSDFVKSHVADIAASFQSAVADVLVGKTFKAANKFGLKRVALTGGVARNSHLRKRCMETAEESGFEIYLPQPEYCTDNAAMIGKAGLFHLSNGRRSDYSLEAIPNLKLDTVSR